MTMCTQFFAFTVLLFDPLPKGSESRESFFAACKDQEIILLKKLSESSIWEPSNRTDLLGYLRIVEIVRPKSLLPILCEHSTYFCKSDQSEIKLLPHEIEYPVYRALRSYGSTAVSPMFAYLKKNDSTESEESDKELYITVLLLLSISDDSQVGKVCAIERIKNEIGRSNIKYRKLAALANHQLLK